MLSTLINPRATTLFVERIVRAKSLYLERNPQMHTCGRHDIIKEIQKSTVKYFPDGLPADTLRAALV
jgi:hypothetical protein